MKRILFLVFLILTLFTAMSQVPAGFNYQAVVRNNSGEVVSNKTVKFRISILLDSESGPDVYTETHSVSTGTLGLVNLVIGKGTRVSGSFDPSLWGNNKHYFKVELDPENGNEFSHLGTTELFAVPYAFHAQTAGEVADNSISSIKIEDGAIDETDLADHSVTVAKLGSHAVTKEKIADKAVTEEKLADNSITEEKIIDGAVSSVKLARDGATIGQVLKWDGTTWLPAADETGSGESTPTGPAGGDLSGTFPNPVIGEGNVTTAKLANNAVTTAKLANNGVAEAKIADGAVVEAKLAANAVNSDKIADGTIIETDLADGAVTEAKIADGAIATDKMENNAVTTEKIAPDVVSAISGISNDGGNIDLVAGSNVTITPDDENNTITIAAAGSASDNLGNHTATQNIRTNGQWISGDGGNEGIFIMDNGKVGIGINTPGSQQNPGFIGLFESRYDDQGAAIIGTNTYSGSQVNYGGYFEANGSSNGIGVYAKSSSWYGKGLYGNATGQYGVGVVGYSSSDEGKGVSGISSDNEGIGVYGSASNEGLSCNYGGYFVAKSELGVGVYGLAEYSSHSLNTNYGGFFQSEGEHGTGAKGIATGADGWGISGEATNGIGVHGEGGGSTGKGVYGHSYGDEGCGVKGVAWSTSSTTKSSYGGYFESHSRLGRGVYASATGEYGRAVYAISTGENGYGITAYSDNIAGYFGGNVSVVGTLSKSAGSFKIDHPDDPENKYLQHSFVESPDMMNIYNGNVILNNAGEAIVEMPAYFGSLNMDYRYQLTAIGAPGPNLHIAEEINNNQFKIAGGSSGMKVSWQVTGIRNDAYARNHRIEVEIPKTEAERGKYLFPEENNQPKSFGIDYDAYQNAIHLIQKSETENQNFKRE
ncbi:MAG: hypothetical protein K9H26_13525 [Prolixibacteraceae bacterium]|nr:hypothetical protein [Prolixibacteraceae bacterium]